MSPAPPTQRPTPRPTGPAAPSLADLLLAEERDLPAAARFAEWHGRQVAHDDEDRQAGQTYQHLIPLTQPRPGEQYAFEVDLDACSGCKACVTACHALNGLDHDEAWRRVGLLITPIPDRPTGSPQVPTREPALHHVTTACHHCVDPACLNGCPVLAYDKDPHTGVVRHLDDQCIGCTYCVMTCPYEVPRFSRRLGIVRKCDLCHDRLATGEAPACAQACPNGAIRIGLVDVQERTAAHRPDQPTRRRPAGPGRPHNTFLPGSPDPALTIPTTRFVSRSSRCEDGQLQAADEADARPAEGHSPLVVMLVLTQAAAGVFLIAATTPPAAPANPFLSRIGLGLLIVGLTASVLHLGQPLRAWRVFLGLRRSWLSREAVVLGGFGALATTAALAPWLPLPLTGSPLRLITALTGLGGVCSSIMVYAVTGRAFWAMAPTALRFFGTTLALGPVWALPVLPVTPAWRWTLIGIALIGGLATLIPEVTVLAHRRDERWTPLRRSAGLLLGPLRHRVWTRWATAVLGAMALLASGAATGTFPSMLATAAAVLLTLSSLLERHLFFAAASPDRMPGGIPK